MRRGTSFLLLAMMGGLFVGLVACGTADANGSGVARGPQKADAGESSENESDDDDSKSTKADDDESADTDRMPDGMNGTGTGTGTGTGKGPDGDGDGFADDVDCDPASKAIAGAKVLDDTLATDKGFFAVPEGFPAASWAFDNAYSQTRVATGSDVSFFSKEASVTDAIVELKASSVKSPTANPINRQMFILFGASVTGGQFSAVGCGLEVDGTQAHTQKTSVLKFGGTPANVTTTIVDRVDRGAVQFGEEFGVKATLVGGTLKCEVTQANGTTVATGSNLGNAAGAIGLFARQTSALFKNAKICKVK